MTKVRDGITLVVQTGLAAASSAEPVSAGIAAAGSWLAPHILSIYDTNAAWKREAQEVWIDILAESEGNRRDQYKAVEDEFHRQKLIIEWLQEELEKVSGRVDSLEAKARNLLEQSESLIRTRPEPEMRPYLTNAYRNAVYNQPEFSAVWVRRLSEKLQNLGADHLKMLCAFVGDASVPVSAKGHQMGNNISTVVADGPDALLVFEELIAAELVARPAEPLGERVVIKYIGYKLSRFVTVPPSQ